MKRVRLRRRRHEGMTLIEIMIVVVIMAMISAGVGFAVLQAKAKADIDMTTTAVRNIGTVAEAYLLQHGAGSCPTIDVLRDAGILRRGGTTDDPWGHPFRIECGEAEVNVRSAGPDGQMESEDDIAVF